MNSVYAWLLEYVKYEKKLVEYMYVLYIIFSKYWKWIYNYIEQISAENNDLWEILKFFKEGKYTKKDVYKLLEYWIKKSWYNIANIELWIWISLDSIKMDKNTDIIVSEKDGDSWVFVKTADNKIYKRFLLDDVKKVLGL